MNRESLGGKIGAHPKDHCWRSGRALAQQSEGRGFEPRDRRPFSPLRGTTWKKNVPVGLEPTTSRLKGRRANHSGRRLPCHGQSERRTGLQADGARAGPVKPSLLANDCQVPCSLKPPRCGLRCSFSDDTVMSGVDALGHPNTVPLQQFLVEPSTKIETDTHLSRRFDFNDPHGPLDVAGRTRSLTSSFPSSFAPHCPFRNPKTVPNRETGDMFRSSDTCFH